LTKCITYDILDERRKKMNINNIQKVTNIVYWAVVGFILLFIVSAVGDVMWETFWDTIVFMLETIRDGR
jgi:hypothetical protein